MILEIWASAGAAALLIAAIAVFCGTLVQRLAGQGLGMVASPILAIVLPEYLPATVLLIGCVVGLSSSAMDFSTVEKKELPAGFAGRALGAVLAAWIAAHIAGTTGIAVVIGVTVLIAVALSLAGLRAPINNPNLFIAGTSAGLMGTLTAIGAPPMAMLYQFESPQRARAMQNIFFAFGMIVSILSLAAFGLIKGGHLIIAITLLPAVFIGLAVASRLVGRFERHSIRPFALGLSTIAALILLAKNLL